MAWAPQTLRIPLGLVSLRARNASVVSVAEPNADASYALATLVLDDNSLAPLQQASSYISVLTSAVMLRVLSCQRCGLQLDVDVIIWEGLGSFVNSLQELHLAQVMIRIAMRPR